MTFQAPLLAATAEPVWTCLRCRRPSWAGQTLRPPVARALIEAQLDGRGELRGAA